MVQLAPLFKMMVKYNRERSRRVVFGGEELQMKSGWLIQARLDAEEEILPKIHAYFGSETRAGISNDIANHP